MSTKTKFKIHPAIGIARVGDSRDEFYLAPETSGALPTKCDKDGIPVTDAKGKEVKERKFKDAKDRVKRQAARFRIYVYDDDSPKGRELKLKDTVEVADQQFGQLLEGTVTDISWTVWVANKKAAWYEFEQLEGEHGYAKDHPLRNAKVKGKDARRRLIIDPGSQTVSASSKKADRVKHFAKDKNPGAAQSFPPPLQPYSIDTLGEIRATKSKNCANLLVLGGYGNSGSVKSGVAEPIITHYANNDGWFDDISDGPVQAMITIEVAKVNGNDKGPAIGSSYTITSIDPAWVIVGYPAYVPEIPDIISMEDVVYDVAIREHAYDPVIFGAPPFDDSPENNPSGSEELDLWKTKAQYNSDYRPWFWRDIWPILKLPDDYQWVFDFDGGFTGADPHNNTPGHDGNFDPTKLSTPPYEGQDPAEREAFFRKRAFIYGILRQPGQENQYGAAPNQYLPTYLPRGMPFLCGDNPIQNTVPSKFLRLTETQLFLLKQWADGKFINECREEFEQCKEGMPVDEQNSAPPTGEELDQGVLSNVLGGAFCPGGEATWIMRNPAIYASPFRINLKEKYSIATTSILIGTGAPLLDSGSLSLKSNLAKGLEPGDITKYMALPWQADFNECSTQKVDVTYENWNKIDLKSIGDPASQLTDDVPWWPTHRPLAIFTESANPDKKKPSDPDYTLNSTKSAWSRGIPGSPAGDLKMVTSWPDLGFILKRTKEEIVGGPAYVEVERNNDNL